MCRPRWWFEHAAKVNSRTASRIPHRYKLYTAMQASSVLGVYIQHIGPVLITQLYTAAYCVVKNYGACFSSSSDKMSSQWTEIFVLMSLSTTTWPIIATNKIQPYK